MPVLRFSGRVPPAGTGSAGISNVARLEIHLQDALQNTRFNDTQARPPAPARGAPCDTAGVR
jgi:hypothetical protein